MYGSACTCCVLVIDFHNSQGLYTGTPSSIRKPFSTPSAKWPGKGKFIALVCTTGKTFPRCWFSVQCPSLKVGCRQLIYKSTMHTCRPFDRLLCSLYSGMNTQVAVLIRQELGLQIPDIQPTPCQAVRMSHFGLPRRSRAFSPSPLSSSALLFKL